MHLIDWLIVLIASVIKIMVLIVNSYAYQYFYSYTIKDIEPRLGKLFLWFESTFPMGWSRFGVGVKGLL